MKSLPFMCLCVIVFCCLRAAISNENNLPVINIGHVGHDHHLALFLAADLSEKFSKNIPGNYYLKKLIDKKTYRLLRDDKEVAHLNIVKVGGGSKMPQTLASGSIDISFGGVAPVIFAIDRGAKLKIIAPANADGDMLMMKPEFEASNWHEFVKKVKDSSSPLRIGYKAPKAVAFIIFCAALREEGIPFTTVGLGEQAKLAKDLKIVLVNLGKGANMIPSLASGAVDGFVMNQPVVAIAQSKGVGKVVCELNTLPPDGKWLSHPCCCVAATELVLKKHPEEVKALLEVFTEAIKHVNDSETISIASRWTGATPEIERKSLPTNHFVFYPNQPWRIGMQVWFEMMRTMGVFRGKLANIPLDKVQAMVADYSFLPMKKNIDK